MPDFVDRARIFIKSGKGGDGHVSFYREKFVANGGPDGGDGGRGGDVIFVVDQGLNSLADYHYGGKYKAENGQDGGRKRCTGKSGADLELKVPEGTVVREASTGRVIVDMSGENRRVTVLKGGRGGTGNMHYATSTMQAPHYAKPGGEASEVEVLLELKVIADVGLVGFPNVGKSTILSRASNAKPKIAGYPFTTLHPHLGVVSLEEGKSFVMADIPGLIEGAADGAGLGKEFLRHIERTRLLLHVVDASGMEGRDPVQDLSVINRELSGYGAGLEQIPQIVAANKTELLSEAEREEVLDRLRAVCEPAGVPVYPISAVTGEGLKELLYAVAVKREELPGELVVFSPEVEREELQAAAATGEIDVSYDEKEHMYVVEGTRIDRMLGYTNLDSEKGFAFFQKFLKDNGVLDRLNALGIQDGDTVRLYGHQFDYYHSEDISHGNDIDQ
ncbi:MAG: GTPase ObgE [Lachnospiraceae bacterium]|nr:GTPase ObgE [Lachnospiraceae bacterium]